MCASTLLESTKSLNKDERANRVKSPSLRGGKAHGESREAGVSLISTVEFEQGSEPRLLLKPVQALSLITVRVFVDQGTPYWYQRPTSTKAARLPEGTAERQRLEVFTLPPWFA